MESKIMNVTPEMAKRWLSHNSANRMIRKNTVHLYAQQMAEGKWHLTGQGITIGKDGQLLDGQHRLSAIIESNTIVPMLVCTDADVVTTYDNGLSRSIADQIRLASPSKNGTMYSVYGIATARLSYQLAHYNALRSQKIATDDLDSFIDAHYDTLYWIATSVNNSAKGVKRAIVAATLFCLYCSDVISTNDLEHFMLVLKTGLSKEETDAPIIGLRNKLMIGFGAGSSADKEIGLRVQYAIKSYLQGSTSVTNKPIAKSYDLDFLGNKNKEEK